MKYENSRYLTDPSYSKARWKRIFKSYRDENKFLIRKLNDYLKKGMTISEAAKMSGISKGTANELLAHGFESFINSIKNEVKKRDKNRCTLCKTKKENLHIHHLGHHFNHSINNLITLCGSCHPKIEGWCRRNNLEIRFKK